MERLNQSRLFASTFCTRIHVCVCAHVCARVCACVRVLSVRELIQVMHKLCVCASVRGLHVGDIDQLDFPFRISLLEQADGN